MQNILTILANRQIYEMDNTMMFFLIVTSNELC